MIRKMYLLSVSLITNVCLAQQANNSSFENWTTTSDPRPVDWYDDGLNLCNPTTDASLGTKAVEFSTLNDSVDIIGGGLFYAQMISLNNYVCKEFSGSPDLFQFDYKFSGDTNCTHSGYFNLLLKNGTTVVFDDEFIISFNGLDYSTYSVYLPGVDCDSIRMVFSLYPTTTCPLSTSTFIIDNLRFSEGSADVLEKKINSINLYPNPFEKKISIKIEGQINNGVSLYDENGRIIPVEYSISNDTIELLTEELKSGVYFLRVLTDTGVQDFKVVK